VIRTPSGPEALRAHVETLAGEIGERNVFRPRALADAADCYPHYHSPDDTPDKLDYGALARVAEGLANAVETLAAEE